MKLISTIEKLISKKKKYRFTLLHPRNSSFFLMLLAIVLLQKVGWGQQSITTAGTAVTQNFNGMGSSGTAALPTGFRVNTSANWSTGTTATTLSFGTTGTGAVTGTSGGGVINWANGITASSTDRALGFLTSGSFSSPRSIIYAFTNNTGSTVTSIDLSFDYEKYRSGSRAFDWTFFHGATATAVNTAATSGNQSYAADANNTVISNPPTSISKTVTLTSLSIANGTTYYIAWTYTGSGGATNAQGLGVDNFSITLNAGATPSITLADNGPQITAANVNQGITNVVLHKFSLAVTTANATITGMTCTTAGSYVSADVTNLKCWYQTGSTFTGSGTLLSTLTTPGAAGSKTFPSFTSQTINSGSTGYIFITADIASTATHNNTISVNAITTSDVTFSSGTKSGSTTAGGAQTFQDLTAPTVSTYNPADNATGVTVNSNLVLTFNENVQAGTAGNIIIYASAGPTVFESIPYNDSRITFSTNTVTINPTGTFANNTAYHVLIDNTAIRDDAGNNFAGISSNTTWNFTTVPLPSIDLADNGTQVTAANINQGATAVVLHKFSLAVTSANTSLTGITCTTAGSYAVADITNLKVRYSADATLEGADATLSTITPATAGTQTFTSFTSQAINNGSTGYIFITADIASTATHNNTISVNAISTSNLTFSAGNKSGSTNAGGTQTIKDVTAPTVSAYNPLDNATGVSETANLVLTFSENISAGTGNILIYATSGPTLFETIPVGDARVTISGNQVTINPTGTLAFGTAYYINIASTAITDAAGNAYAGISNGTTWNFTTNVADFVNLTALGTAATENFTGLANSGTSSTTPQGWYFNESGSNANSTYTGGTGSSATGETYSFGVAGTNAVTDRAFGGLLSGNLIPTIGAKIKNSTGSTINSLNISYRGEQWRLGATGRNDKLLFQYSTNATSLTTGTWTSVTALDFSAPKSTGATGELDGNTSGNNTTVTNSITGLSLANGGVLWIRFTDEDASGADDGLGIDDFSITGCQTFTAGTIDNTGETICSNTIPTAEIGSTVAASGGGTITYQWQSSTVADFSSGVTTISSNTATYTPTTALTQDTWFRRQARNNTCDNSFTSSGNTWKITVNPMPTITLGSNPSVCSGTTTANLTYSATSNSPTQYSINYNATAEGQGFVDVSFAANNLPTSPIVLVVPGAAAAGTYNGTLTVRNATTNCESITYNIEIIVQAITTTPSINSPVCLDASSVSGTSSEADGTTINVYKAGTTLIGTTTVSGGTWTITGISPALTTGEEITATAQATGKCLSATSSSVTVQGSSATPTINAPICVGATTVSGTSSLATGSSITVYKDGNPVGTTSVIAGGTWSLTGISPALASGEVITATGTASGGCSSSGSGSVTVATSAAPAITSPICAGTATVSGTSSEANGTTINLYKAGTTLIGTTTVSSGNWTITGISPVLASGDVLTATATAGGKCVSSNSASVTVATVSAPSITSPVCVGATTVNGTSTEVDGTTINLYKAGTTLIGTTTVSGGAWTVTGISPALISGDVITASAIISGGCVGPNSSVTVATTDAPVIDAPLCPAATTVTGTSTEANGTTINVYKAGTTLIGTTTVSGGVWTATVTALAAGDVITATAMASGECVSDASAGVTVQNNSVAPVITGTYCPGATSVNGTSSETNGTTINVYKAGTTLIGTTTVSGGVWTATVASLTASDVITATAIASGECVSAASASVTVQSNSAAPVINAPICAGTTSVSGTSSEANGTTINVYKAGTTLIGTATVASGVWTATVASLTASDVITATATAGGKCVSVASSGVTVLSNTSAPAITGTYCSGATIINGTSSEADGTTINLYKSGNTLIGTTTVSGGNWTVTGITPALTSGEVITATASATGKCESTTSASVTVNPLPTASISSNNGPICQSATAVFNLTGTANAVVTYNINAGGNTTITLNGSGTASVSVANATVNQTINLVSVQNPSTGCSQNISGSSTVTVNTAPAALVLTGSAICSGTGTITSSTSAIGVSYQLYNSSNNTVQSAQSGTGSGLTWSGLSSGSGYYVIATIGSCNATSNAVDVVAATPTTPVLTGSTTCTTPGTDGRITTSTSQLNVNYQLYDAGNSPVQAAKAGTGSALTWTGVSIGSGYYVIATYAFSPFCFSQSNAVNITGAICAYAEGDYRSLGSGNWVSNSSTPAIWERYVSGVWVSSNSPSFSSTNSLYLQPGNTITTGGSFGGSSVNLKIIGGTFNCNHSGTTGSILVYDGGQLNVNAALTNSGSFEVEDNATVTINHRYGNGTENIPALWNGTENFHPNSNLVFTNFDCENDFLIPDNTTISTNTYSGYTAAFGNVILDFEDNLGAGDDWIMLAGGTTINLAHGDLIFRTNSSADATIRLATTGTVTSGIGGDFIVDETYTGTQVINLKTSGTLNFIIKGDMQLDAATVRVLAGGVAGSSSEVTIEGNLNITPSAVLDFNTTIAGGSPAPAAIVNLKGDLTVAGSGLLQNTNSSNKGQFNFTGTGDGLTAATTQTIDIASTSSNENRYIDFNINSGAYVQLINRDFELGTNSSVTVKDDGVFDFGFNGTTPLNVTISGSQTGTIFSSEVGSILKVSSPDGINTSGSTGNVRTVASNRSFNQTATFHYIGKQNQVTGTGLTTSANGKVLIVDLTDNNTQLTLTNSTGITNNTTVSPTGGKLDIRKGQFIETETNYITGSSGTLYMTSGTLYRIAKGSANKTAADADLIPRLLGTTYPFNLAGGTIELSGTGSGNQVQTLRGQRSYANLLFSGGGSKYVSSGIVYDNINMTGNFINGMVTVGTNTIFDSENNTMGSGESAGTTQTSVVLEPGSRYRTSGSGTKPDATGSYSIDASATIEYYGTSVQLIRATPIHGNIEVNGTNVSLTGNGTTVTMKSGTTFTVRDGATFNIRNTNGFRNGPSTAINNLNSPSFAIETNATLNYNCPDAAQIVEGSDYDCHLTLSNGGAKTFSQTLTSVSGDFTVSGGPVTPASEMAFNGNRAQNIAGLLNYNHLIFSGTGGFTKMFTGDASFTGAMTFPSGTGFIDLDGAADNLSFTIRSTEAATARIANINNWTINGKAIAERYIPSQRRWRLMSIPVTGETIRQAWTRQVNGSYPDPNCFGSPAQTAGSGTLITGHSMSSCTNAVNAGFDHVVTGGASSIRFYNSAQSNPWASATSTPNILAAPSHNGYLLFVRGDRTVQNIGSGVTTLRPKGAIRQNDLNFTISNKFVVLGNPYPSPVHLDNVFQNSGNNTTITRNFFIWDANVGDQGGYRELSWNGINAYTCSGCNGIPSDSLLVVHSGQSVIVERRDDYTTTNMLIREEDKSDIINTRLPFRNSGTGVAEFLIDFYRASGATTELYMDGAVARFNNLYSKGTNEVYDVYKNNQFEENISLVRNNYYMSIESRPVPTVNDTIFIPFYFTTNRGYALKFSTSEMATLGLSAVLQDEFTATETPVPLDGSSFVYPFSVTTAAGSKALTRFRVVFKPSTVTPVFDLFANKGISIYPNPVVKNQPLQLQFRNSAASRYELVLYNITGVVVSRQTVIHPGGNSIQKIQLTTQLAAGTYIAELSDLKGNRSKTKLVVQ